MIVEIISVGTELLLGDTLDTNSQHISSTLAAHGVDVYRRVTVGDNRERIAQAVRRAVDESDAVVITGGLGPTHDDLTREALADVAGVELVADPEIERWLRSRFARMGRVMSDANLKQATFPRGAEVIANPRGTAPGIAIEIDGSWVYALPGVPVEMREMLTDHVLGRLSGEQLVVKTLKVAGMGESDVAQQLKGLIEELDDPAGAKIALLSSPGEVRVKVSAKGRRAEAEVDGAAERVRGVLGSAVFGDLDDTLAGVVVKAMKTRGLTLATAESVTGGMLTSEIVGVPGTSDVLVAGYVTYARSAKVALGVPSELLIEHGAVSDPTARAMAEAARIKAGSDVALATTGEAGPEPDEEPVGTVYVALAAPGRTYSRRFIAPGERAIVRRWASQAALNLLRLWLMGEISQ